MGWRISIRFANTGTGEDADLVHRARNFGEALYSSFRDGSMGAVSLDEADRTTGAMTVHSVHKRDVRRALTLVNGLAAKHFPDVTPTITAERDG